MTAALTSADLRLRQAQKQMQAVLRQHVTDSAASVFADASFIDNAEVIPIRAAAIGQLVLSAQQLLASHAGDLLAAKLKLKGSPAVTKAVTERPGVEKTDEYSRPFYVALHAIKGGKSDAEAMAIGESRLRNLTSTDMQMAKVRQARIVLRAAGRKTFRRVTTSGNPCSLCQIAATQIYYTEDLMPIHQGEPGCQCDVEPDEDVGHMSDEEAQAILEGIPKPQKATTPKTQRLRGLLSKSSDPEQDELDEVRKQGVDPEELKDYLAIREHGEIGPVLTWAHQSFTGPEDLPEPPKYVATPTGGTKAVNAAARAHLDAINLQARRLAG